MSLIWSTCVKREAICAITLQSYVSFWMAFLMICAWCPTYAFDTVNMRRIFVCIFVWLRTLAERGKRIVYELLSPENPFRHPRPANSLGRAGELDSCLIQTNMRRSWQHFDDVGCFQTMHIMWKFVDPFAPTCRFVARSRGGKRKKLQWIPRHYLLIHMKQSDDGKNNVSSRVCVCAGTCLACLMHSVHSQFSNK